MAFWLTHGVAAKASIGSAAIYNPPLKQEMQSCADDSVLRDCGKERACPSWWRMPMNEWPPHTKLEDFAYKALLPPCWHDPHHGLVWRRCNQCRAYFDPQVGVPSKWICRCGIMDMEWRHREPPHVDTTCRACNDLQRAWSGRVMSM